MEAHPRKVPFISKLLILFAVLYQVVGAPSAESLVLGNETFVLDMEELNQLENQTQIVVQDIQSDPSMTASALDSLMATLGQSFLGVVFQLLQESGSISAEAQAQEIGQIAATVMSTVAGATDSQLSSINVTDVQRQAQQQAFDVLIQFEGQETNISIIEPTLEAVLNVVGGSLAEALGLNFSSNVQVTSQPAPITTTTSPTIQNNGESITSQATIELVNSLRSVVQGFETGQSTSGDLQNFMVSFANGFFGIVVQFFSSITTVNAEQISMDISSIIGATFSQLSESSTGVWSEIDVENIQLQVYDALFTNLEEVDGEAVSSKIIGAVMQVVYRVVGQELAQTLQVSFPSTLTVQEQDGGLQYTISTQSTTVSTPITPTIGILHFMPTLNYNDKTLLINNYQSKSLEQQI